MALSLSRENPLSLGKILSLSSLLPLEYKNRVH
jgi:hypothetical protein